MWPAELGVGEGGWRGAHLRKAYSAPIAMHASDVGKVERGDMFWSPDSGRALATTVAKTTLVLIGVRKFEPFEPDVLLGDGQRLDEYGLDAEVIHFPGHTPGSRGVLSRAGDLFCGDLLTNTRKPVQNSMAEAVGDAQASVASLKDLDVQTIYPGHGKAFPIGLL